MAEKKTYWQRRQRNAYAGAAAGAAAGGVGGYKLIRRGPSGTRGLALSGGAAAAGLGGMGGLVAGAKATRRKNPKKKVKKSMDSISAFGVDHGVVSKAFTGFLKLPQETHEAARAAKLSGALAHEKKVTGNKPLGFSLKNQQKQNSMYRGPLNTGKPKRS